jgi:hypothetical protein
VLPLAGLAVTSQCILCIPREGEEGHAPEPGWQCCQRAHDRLLAALRDIPLLVDELAGGGYVQRDGFDPVVTFPAGHERAGELVPHRDPVANVLTAGPTNGARTGPRVMGGGERSLPIRIDPTDLLAPARPASLAVADTGVYASDQIGHLAVATELEFWARDWADLIGHHIPLPTVPELARWLLDRLDWACATHPALDEFAGKLTHLRTVLTAATGRLPARPDPVDRPCPACGWWALVRPPDSEYIECGHCARVLTADEYRDHLEDVIKTNWTRFEAHDERTWPGSAELLWVREDILGAVVAGYFDRPRGAVWRSWSGETVLHAVSYWAPVSAPADPGPAKEDAA